MKVISNTLKPEVETWDDPGDYPNGLAAGPLPSYKYLAGCEGEVVLEFEPADFLTIVTEEFLGDPPEAPKGIWINKWDTPTLKMVDGKLQVILTVKECEGDPTYVNEPDYDDIGD